jgi:glycosyltransferase involved in cell wall biosynthesis
LHIALVGMSVELEDRRLSVAIVAPSLEILGGQAVQARRLLDAWADDRDVDARLVPINPTPPRWLRGAMRVKYLRTVLTQLMYYPLLFRELKRADVVHVFSASYFSFLLAPLPAVLVARFCGRPVLMNYRSGEAPDHLARSRVARTTLRSVNVNVVPSRFLQDVFAAYAIEARIIPNIIDRARFAFRERNPLRPRLVSTRNFEPLYNVACTLRAFARVQQRYPEATLTLVGAGSQDGPLRALTEELKLRRVTFAGRVPPEDIWRFYADADIYVQTPDIDNMPSSILEAYASGLPVISTGAGGVPAMLTDGVHGLLSPVNDDAHVARNICRLLEDPDLTRRVVQAASDVAEGLAWPRVRDLWLAVYRELAAGRIPGVAAVRPI